MSRSVILSMGEALAEFVQVGAHTPLEEEGTYRGPFASGAPLIFATAVARLGGRSAFLGMVGDDEFGGAIRSFLAQEGVAHGGVALTDALPTSASFVVNHPDGTRSFFFHMRNGAAGVPPPLPEPAFLQQVAWAHINGSCLAMNDAWWQYCIQVARLVRESGGRVSLDPNIRAELASPEQIRALVAPIIEVASFVFPSGEEAQLITGEATTAAACAALRATPQNEAVVLKQGADGCTVHSESGKVSVPSFPVKEVDATGAGDTFDAAFLWALQHGASLDTAALWANAAGALSVTVTGPIEGAPRRENVAAFLRAHGRQTGATEHLLATSGGE
ncbi:MAG: sugar kinase [Chloroflexi bacterium]|nr:sugar kinase [Chloroflexota bacterium]